MHLTACEICVPNVGKSLLMQMVPCLRAQGSVHLEGLFIPCAFPCPDGAISILVAKFAIWEQEKISVSAAMTAQVVIFIFVQIMTPKAAPILFTQGVLETETLSSPVDYVKHVIHCYLATTRTENLKHLIILQVSLFKINKRPDNNLSMWYNNK